MSKKEPEVKEFKPLPDDEEMEQEERMKNCRICCVRVLWKFASEAIMAMRMIKSYHVPTMGVDKYWRLYWNPHFVKKLRDEEINAVLLHEVSHLMRKHSKRALPVHTLWNIAADMEINDDIEQDKAKLPEGCVWPKTYDAQPNLTGEEYYIFLKENKVEVKQMQGDGSGEEGDGENQGPPGSQIGGSGADGQKRPWEGSDEDNDAVGEEQGKIIIEQVAKAIKSSDNQPGNSPSDAWREWARNTLEHKVDWRTVLRNTVNSCLNVVRGNTYRSYKVPSRRQSKDFIFPGVVSPDPRVKVIIDTSGSMSMDLLDMCIGEIAGLLKNIPSRNLAYVAGDTTTASEGKINSIKQISLKGGGGTDMGAIIEQHADGYDIIIVLTDGYTPWCPPIKTKVVACIVAREGEKFDYDMPPNWIKTVVVNEQ